MKKTTKKRKCSINKLSFICACGCKVFNAEMGQTMCFKCSLNYGDYTADKNNSFELECRE